MNNFIYDYFVLPMMQHEGYNIVNTLTYAAIALVAVYLIWRTLAGRVKIDSKFIRGALAFVLLGSTMRVVTDSIDSRVFAPVTPVHQLVLDSHIFDYGYLTISPGIYVVTAALYLITLLVSLKLKKPDLTMYVGLILWAPLFLLLVPFMKYAVYGLPVLALALIPTYLAYRFLSSMPLTAIVMGQALDGAATFFIIDVFSGISGINYFEQHVLSNFIGQIFGTFFAFYLIKVAISFAAAYLIKKEDMSESDKNYIALILMIMGFAPGIRDLLRMVVGA